MFLSINRSLSDTMILFSLSLILIIFPIISAAQPHSLTSMPTKPQRPTEFIGRWCGLGLCIQLSETGTSQISYLDEDTQKPKLDKKIETGLWWIENHHLCLTAGLKSICEPYAMDTQRLSLTLKGVALLKQTSP